MPDLPYRKLRTDKDEIRLMTLLPGKFDDPIEFRIFHAPLRPPKPRESSRLSIQEIRKTLPKGWIVFETREGRYLFRRKSGYGPRTWDHPDPNVDRKLYDPLPPQRPSLDFEVPYQALSYVWGSRKNLVNVKASFGCGLSRQNIPFPVTKNLDEALRYVRKQQGTQTLWCDAICINQNDVKERNEQVKRMGDVYAFARRVLVWLGPADKTSSHALYAMLSYDRNFEVFKNEMLCRSPDAGPDWKSFDDYMSSVSTYTWHAVECLIKRPWFWRVWILQEAVSNENTAVLCGHDMLPWPALCKVLLWWDEYAKTPLSFKSSVAGWWAVVHDSPRDLSLLGLLRWTSRRYCEDPRDRCYGILSLCGDLRDCGLQPRYDASVTDAYKEMFLEYIRATRYLNILWFCGQYGTSAPGPSWVPNLQMRRNSDKVPTNLEASGKTYATYEYKAPLQFRVMGKFCAVIINRISLNLPAGTLRIGKALRNIMYHQSPKTSVDELDCLCDALIDVLMFGRLEETTPEVNFPSAKEVRDTITVNGNDSLSFPAAILGELMTAYLLVTDKGHLGISWARLQKGDVVSVMLGCSFPVILRPSPNDTFQVVGPCYVYGLMASEALIGPVPPPFMFTMIDTWGNNNLRFMDRETGDTTSSDPRLPPLPQEWVLIEGDDNDPGKELDVFKNIKTGETQWRDPRMTPEALEERGIKLDWITLV